MQTHTDTQHRELYNTHSHTQKQARTHNIWVPGCGKDRGFSLYVDCRSASVCPCSCAGVFAASCDCGCCPLVCVSPAFVLRGCCVPTTPGYPATRRHKVSFSPSAEGVEGGQGGRPRPEGGGQGSSWAPLPGRQFPAKVRCPAAAPAAPGRDRPARGRLSGVGGGWVPSSHLARGGPAGSPRGAGAARRRRSPGAGGGSGAGPGPVPVPTAAFLPPRESPGRPLPLWHFRPGRDPPSLAQAACTLRGGGWVEGGRTPTKGPGTPSLRRGSSSMTQAARLQMCFPDVPSLSPSAPCSAFPHP